MNAAVLLLAVVAAAASPAATLFAAGDFNAARTAYKDELARRPDDADALLGLARIALYDDDLETAIKDAGGVLTLAPNMHAAQRVIETARQRRDVFDSAAQLAVPQGGIVVSFVESEPLPAIELRIDGHPATLLIDTGAADVTLDPDFAARLGLTITGGHQGTFLGARTAQVRDAVVQSIAVGPLTLRHVGVTILPLA